MSIRVIKCTCHGVKFSRLKEIATKQNAKTISELQRHVRFADNCKRCVPYVLQMLETGKTEFHEILENGDPRTSQPIDPGPTNDYGDGEEL